MPSPLRLSILASAASAAVLAIAGNSLSRPERLMERQLADAIERVEPAHSLVGVRADAGIDRSHVHLSRLPEPALAGPPLALGSRISFAGPTGVVTAYEVTQLRPIAEGSNAEAGEDLPRLLLVVAAPVDRRAGRTIRFIIDADAPADGRVTSAGTSLQPL